MLPYNLPELLLSGRAPNFPHPNESIEFSPPVATLQSNLVTFHRWIRTLSMTEKNPERERGGRKAAQYQV